MARYIDADKLNADFLQTNTANADIYLALRKILDKAPTAENVAEVVFCQDCKFAHRVLDEYGNLDYKCRKMNDYMSPIDFCSRGGRKEKL